MATSPSLLLSLPTEMLYAICEAVREVHIPIPSNRKGCDENGYLTQRADANRDLRNFSFTCRTLGTIAQRTLHADAKTSELFRLVRTLLERPDLRSCVQDLLIHSGKSQDTLADENQKDLIRRAVSEAGTPIDAFGEAVDCSQMWPYGGYRLVPELGFIHWPVEKDSILCSLVLRYCKNLREISFMASCDVFTWPDVTLPKLDRVNFGPYDRVNARNTIYKIAPNLRSAHTVCDYLLGTQWMVSTSLSHLVLQSDYCTPDMLRRCLETTPRLQVLDLNITFPTIWDSPIAEVFDVIQESCSSLVHLSIRIGDTETYNGKAAKRPKVKNALQGLKSLETFGYASDVDLYNTNVDLCNFLPPSIRTIEIQHTRVGESHRIVEATNWYLYFAEIVPVDYPNLRTFRTYRRAGYVSWWQPHAKRFEKAFKDVGVDYSVVDRELPSHF